MVHKAELLGDFIISFVMTTWSMPLFVSSTELVRVNCMLPSGKSNWKSVIKEIIKSLFQRYMTCLYSCVWNINRRKRNGDSFCPVSRFFVDLGTKAIYYMYKL